MFLTGHEGKSAEYYSDIYKRGYDTAGYHPIYQATLQIIQRFPASRVLELGCGIGDLGRMIIDAGFPYRGFDFSAEAVRQSQARCPQGDFRIGDLYDENMYLPHDYNIVVALEVLEHVDDLRVLNLVPPGARIIASVPDYDDVSHLRLYRDIQKDIIERFAPFLHIITITTATARNAATGAEQKIHLLHGIRILP